MAKTKIEDLSAVEELDKTEQQAVQGGGLKKLKKQARKTATSKSTGIAALQGAASAAVAVDSGLNAADSGLDTAGHEIATTAEWMHVH